MLFPLFRFGVAGIVAQTATGSGVGLWKSRVIPGYFTSIVGVVSGGGKSCICATGIAFFRRGLDLALSFATEETKLEQAQKVSPSCNVAQAVESQ